MPTSVSAHSKSYVGTLRFAQPTLARYEKKVMIGTIADCAVVALALMGAWVTYNPPARDDRQRQKIWLSAFAAAGLMYVVSAGAERSAENKRFDDATSGGDNYAYVKAEIIDPKNLTSPVPLSINANGHLGNVSFWIAPVNSKWPEPNYSLVDSPTRPPITLNKGGFTFAKTLPPGKYRVEFNASNGTFVEFLTIEAVNGLMTQYLEVCRGDERLYTFPEPARRMTKCYYPS